MSKRRAMAPEDDFEDTSHNLRILQDKHRKFEKLDSQKAKLGKPTKEKPTEPVKVVDIVEKQPEKKKKTERKPEIKVSQKNELVQGAKRLFSDLESTLSSIESKITPRTPLLSSQIRNLEDLRKEVQDFMDDIVVGVVNDATSNFGFGDGNYDIVKEDVKWKKSKSLLSKIESIFLSHENSSTDDMKILSEIIKRKEDRKRLEKLNKEAQDREWNDLKSRPLKSQIKFFIIKGGPIQGRKEYSDWKGVETLKSAVGMTSKGLSKKKQDDDDELLGESLY